MRTSVPLPESQRCRARALECRATADLFRVDFARHHMLKAAEDFDRIAREARIPHVEIGISAQRKEAGLSDGEERKASAGRQFARGIAH